LRPCGLGKCANSDLLRSATVVGVSDGECLHNQVRDRIGL